MPQGHLGDEPRHLCRLGAVRLQELPPRRHVVKEIGHLQDRALGRPHLTGRDDGTAGDADLRATGRALRPSPQQEMRHRGNTWQRLAPEPERRDRRQVLEPADLAGSVPLECEHGLVRGHAFTVVFDPDEPLAAELDCDGDPCRPGIERVLHQLLDDRRRPLDHLAGRDLVG